MDEDTLKQLCLVKIQNILRSNGQSMIDYPQMPQPSSATCGNLENLLLIEELSYDHDKLCMEHALLLHSMTEEQRNIYDVILSYVKNGQPGVFFVDGFGGIGKTFLWKTITSALRSVGDVVLAGQ